MTTRPATRDDITELARIHETCFPRQMESSAWIRANLASYPETLSYVHELGSSAVGYALWQQISGFREDQALELKQLAVSEAHRNRGLGRQLILDSLDQVATHLEDSGRQPHYVFVKTSVGNPAQGLYESTLGVEPRATLEGMFAQPELILGGPYKKTVL